MRIATWVIAERDRLVREARRSLVRSGPGAGLQADRATAVVDAAHRLLVARLSGAPVRVRTLVAMRAEHRTSLLQAGLQRVVDAACALVPDDSAVLAAAGVEVLASLGLQNSTEGEPISDVARALDETLGAPSSSSRTPGFSALLRVRCDDAATARALALRLVAATGNANVTQTPSSPDEAILVAHGPLVDAVSELVRAGAQLIAALPFDAAVRAAIVAVHDDRDDADLALLDGAVRACACFGARGLIVLDDECWSVSLGSFAAVPGAARSVDPRAPFEQDRWEVSALLARPPFLARDDEVAALAALLRAGGETPRLIVRHGPGGIGKSALLRASLAEAGLLDDKAAILWGAADALQATPYASVVSMLRALARAPAGHPRAWERLHLLVHGLARVLERTRPRAADELRGACDVLSFLLGTSPPDALPDDDDLLDAWTPRTLRGSVRRALLLVAEGLLARADDGRPVVFVVTGAEAMDAPTRDALTFVARRLQGRARVLFFSSTKLRLTQAVEEGFAVDRAEVRPLGVDDARAICAALLDTHLDDALAHAVSALHDKARGSPLYVSHAVRFAVEGGFLQRHGAGWDATRMNDDNIPRGLDRILAGRVARLPSSARLVLGACAALGSTFLPAAIEFVGVRLGLQRDDVARALQLLVETGFLARSLPRPGAPVFRDPALLRDADDELLAFEHPMVRAAAAHAVSDDESRRVHAVVAEALETLLEPRAVAATLARLHRVVGNRRRAIDHLLVAARRARRLDDRDAVRSHVEEALSLCGTTAPLSHAGVRDDHEVHDEHDVQFALRLEHCGVLPHGDELRHALRELVRSAELAGGPRRQGQALARVARYNLFAGDADKAEQASAGALELLRSAGDVRAQGRVLRLLALARFSRRDLDGSRRALEEARRLTDPRDHRALGALEHQAGLMRLEQNDPLGALEHLLAACAHRRATHDVAGEGACLDAIADVYVRCGRLWTAFEIVVRALALRDAVGDDAGATQSMKSRAELLLALGDVDAARKEATRARARARSLGLDRLESQAALVVARAEIVAGDADRGEQVLESLRRRVDEKEDPFAAMEAGLLSARARWLRASHTTGASRERLLKTALQRARGAIALGEKHGFFSGQLLGHGLLGDLLLATGDANGALPHAQKAAEMLDERTATALPLEDALGAWVRVLRALGDDDEAQDVATRACTLLQTRAARIPPDLRPRFWSLPARRDLRVYAGLPPTVIDDPRRRPSTHPRGLSGAPPA